jgi:hypothetical protein
MTAGAEALPVKQSSAPATKPPQPTQPLNALFSTKSIAIEAGLIKNRTDPAYTAGNCEPKAKQIHPATVGQVRYRRSARAIQDEGLIKMKV